MNNEGVAEWLASLGGMQEVVVGGASSDGNICKYFFRFILIQYVCNFLLLLLCQYVDEIDN